MSNPEEPTSVDQARALLDRARAVRHEGRNPDAHVPYLQALALFRSAGDRSGEAEVLIDLADLAMHYNPSGESPFERRKRLCEEGLAIYRELGDKRGMARAMRLLAPSVPDEEGTRLLEESLALSRQEGDEQGIAQSLERLGAHAALHDPVKATAFKEEALARFRGLGDRSSEAGALLSLAISHMGTDRDRFRDYAEQALAAYRETGARKGVAQTLMILATSHPDVETRIAYYTECREICHEIEVTIWEASCLRSLAKIAEEQGEPERAASLRAEADNIHPELPTDPKLQKAFEKALSSRDPDAARNAAQRLFGSLKPRKRGRSSPE